MDLLAHPLDDSILVSVSKDHSVRFWYVPSGKCIALCRTKGASAVVSSLPGPSLLPQNSLPNLRSFKPVFRHKRGPASNWNYERRHFGMRLARSECGRISRASGACVESNRLIRQEARRRNRLLAPCWRLPFEQVNQWSHIAVADRELFGKGLPLLVTRDGQN